MQKNRLSYIVRCVECNKSFASANPLQKKHRSCQKPNPINKYPAIFRTKRLEILFRDNFRCRLCFEDFRENQRAAHVHHIDSDRKNSNPDNLVTLCTTCHRLVENKYTDFDIPKYEYLPEVMPVRTEKKFLFKNIN